MRSSEEIRYAIMLRSSQEGEMARHWYHALKWVLEDSDPELVEIAKKALEQ